MKITNIESMVLSMPMVLDGPTPSSAGVPRTTTDQVLVTPGYRRTRNDRSWGSPSLRKAAGA